MEKINPLSALINYETPSTTEIEATFYPAEPQGSGFFGNLFTNVGNGVTKFLFGSGTSTPSTNATINNDGIFNNFLNSLKLPTVKTEVGVNIVNLGFALLLFVAVKELFFNKRKYRR